MKFTYSATADALAIHLGRGRGRITTKIVAPGIHLDFDQDKKLVGLEILDASDWYTTEELAHLDSPVEWLTMAEAEKEVEPGEAPLSAGSLKNLLAAGVLEGRKIGRTWQVARHVLATYLANRPKRGRPANAPVLPSLTGKMDPVMARATLPDGRVVKRPKFGDGHDYYSATSDGKYRKAVKRKATRAKG